MACIASVGQGARGCDLWREPLYARDDAHVAIALPQAATAVAIDGARAQAVLGQNTSFDLRFLEMAPPALRTELIDHNRKPVAIGVDDVLGVAVVAIDNFAEVLFVDLQARTLLSTLSTVGKYQAAAVHRGKGLGYLANRDLGEVLIVNLATRSVAGSIAVSAKPQAIVVDEALDLAVVAVDRPSGQDRIEIVDLDTNQVIRTVLVNTRPLALALNPDTHAVVVVSDSTSELILLDLTDLENLAPDFVPGADFMKRVAVSTRFNRALVVAAEQQDLVFVQLPSPVPVLTEIVPPDVVAPVAQMSLLAIGDKFIDGSVVHLDGQPLPTRWIDKQHLEADVPIQVLSTGGVYSVKVVTPAPGGGDSNVLNFTVANPLPVLNSVTPLTLPLGMPSATLQLVGSHFVPTSQVHFGAQQLSTMFADPEHLSAIVPAELLASAGTTPVRVFNPVPGGGFSAAIQVSVAGSGLAIDSIAPAVGSVGTVVTVSGTGFVPGATAVRFAGDIPASVVSVTAAQLVVTVPVGAQSGPIAVTTPGGTVTSDPFTVTLPQDFTLTASPASLSLVQNSANTFSIGLSTSGAAAFTSLVRLSTQGLPTGITAEFDPPTISANQTVALTLRASASAAVQSFTFQVVGTFEIAGQEFVRSIPATVNVIEAGRTGVRGRFVTPQGQGIAGISVRVDAIETVTDPAGNFLLLDLPAGLVTLRFDATPANPQFPIWPQMLTLTANQILTIEDWILNPPPGDDKFTTIVQNSAVDQVITDERFPGLEIRIPAGVTIVGWDGVPKARIAVERYDPDKLAVAPPPIPTNSVYQLYFGTAMGGIPSSPIPVTLPNDLGLEPGEQTELWFYDGSPMVGTGEWKQAGTGTVSADGQRIVTDQGSGIPRFCGVCGLPCFKGNQDNTPNAPCPDGCDKNGPSGPAQDAGAPVTLATGQEHGTVTDLALDSPMPIEITRRFNNYDAFALIANFQLSLGVHWTLSYDVVLMPFDFGSGLVRLVLPSNVRADFSRDQDGLFRNSGDSRFRGATLTKIGGQANPLPPTAFVSVGGNNGGGGGAGGASIAPTCNHDNAVYELKFRDGRRWKFEPFTSPTPVRLSGGCPYFLTEMKSREGHTLTLSRDATGKLRQVSNNFGQWVRLEGGTGEVAQGLTDSAGRTVQYEYEFEPMSRGGGSLVLGASRLTRAVTPDGEYRYTYQLDPVAWRAGLSSASTGGGLRVPASALVGSGRSVCDNLKGGALIEDMQVPGISGVIRKVYGKSKRVLQEIYPDGRRLTFQYKVAGACATRPQQTQPCFGPTCPDEDSLASEALGNVVTGGRVVEVSVIDDRGNTSTQKLNGAGLATEVIDGTGQRWKYGRDGENRITAVTDPLGHTWRYQYDDDGNMTFASNPLGTTTEIVYDQKWAEPRQIMRRAANGESIRLDLSYNADHGGLQTLTDPAQQTWGFSYDERELLATATDPLSHVSRVRYDAAGQVDTLSDPLGNTVGLDYDDAGRLTGVSDALGYPTSFALNQKGQVTTRTDALNQTADFEYDPHGYLTCVDNEANQRIDARTYDAMGRLLTRTDAAQETETSTYDAAGNLATYTDKRGRTKRYSYDEVNRLAEIVFADGTTQTRGYDIASRLTEIRDGNSLIRLEYDEANRLTKEITDSEAGRSEVTYTYDGLDRRTGRTLTVNARDIDQTDYGYDAASRLVTITYTAPGLGRLTPEITAYTYDLASRLREKTLPNGIRQVLTYDAADRVTAVDYRGAGDTLVQTLGYAYDGNGNLTERTRSNAASLPDTPITAEYDAANRMTRITINPAAPGARTYSLSYDGEGNLLRKENVADGSDVTTYEWDSRNRLAALSAPGIAASFAYDAIGRRIAKTVNGQAVGYVYDGVQAIGEVVNGQATVTLLTGTQVDEAIARFTDAGKRIFLTDTLGSVLAMTGENQSIAATYVYSPYGEVLEQGDDLSNSTQYTARENDQTGLYFYRARYYDPELKRFIAGDPIGLEGGFNTYAYVGDNPLGNIDFDGLRPLPGQPTGSNSARGPREYVPPRYRNDRPPGPSGGQDAQPARPPPRYPPGLNETLKRDLEEAVENLHKQIQKGIDRQRELRALESVREYMKRVPPPVRNPHLCGRDDDQRTQDYLVHLAWYYRMSFQEWSVAPP